MTESEFGLKESECVSETTWFGEWKKVNGRVKERLKKVNWEENWTGKRKIVSGEEKDEDAGNESLWMGMKARETGC